MDRNRGDCHFGLVCIRQEADHFGCAPFRHLPICWFAEAKPLHPHAAAGRHISGWSLMRFTHRREGSYDVFEVRLPVVAKSVMGKTLLAGFYRGLILQGICRWREMEFGRPQVGACGRRPL